MSIRTVNAVPMVSSLPCQINTKKDERETKIGALDQTNDKQIELIRAIFMLYKRIHRNEYNVKANL